MSKIDWVAKLTSRKFWMAITGLVSGILLALHFDEQTVTQITGIIMSAASVLAYIIGEGIIDAAGARADSETTATSGYVAWEPEIKPPEDPMDDDGK